MTKAMKHLAAAIVALTVVGSSAAFAHGSVGQAKPGVMPSQMGSGMMMGPGNTMGHGMMMNRGMMMPGGMGHGMMMGMGGKPCQNAARATDLSADDVKAVLGGHLKWMGHKRLKVGNVVSGKDGSLIAEITTLDGSLAWKMEVDPKTGAMHMTDQ